MKLLIWIYLYRLVLFEVTMSICCLLETPCVYFKSLKYFLEKRCFRIITLCDASTPKCKPFTFKFNNFHRRHFPWKFNEACVFQLDVDWHEIREPKLHTCKYSGCFFYRRKITVKFSRCIVVIDNFSYQCFHILFRKRILYILIHLCL